MPIWIWINLALRIALWGWIAHTGGWSLGDTDYYRASASMVCHGEWGGDPFRTPLYPWFLCLFGGAFGGFSGVVEVPGALLVQTLLVWSAGTLLVRRGFRRAGAFFLFDPGLLLYSSVAMAEALFATVLLAYGGFVRAAWVGGRRASVGQSAWVGLWLGLVSLCKPVGVWLGAFSVALLGKRLGIRRCALIVAIAFAAVFPRMLWNESKIGRMTLATQGDIFPKAIAALLHYEPQGIPFSQAEKLWLKEHPGPVGAAEWNVFRENWDRWFLKTGVGVARTVFGHYNVEILIAATGQYHVGPAFFKPLDVQGADARQVPIPLWIAMWAAVLAATLYLYFSVVRAVWKARAFDGFNVWAALCALALIGSPMLWGDARFRIPALALWVLILAHCEAKGRARA